MRWQCALRVVDDVFGLTDETGRPGNSWVRRIVEKGKKIHQRAGRDASVMAAIAERENRIREITDQLIEPVPGSFQQRLDDLRAFALRRLSNIRELLGRTETVPGARAVLAEQFGKFTLSRVKQPNGWSYSASGSVNFFGNGLVRVDGAGGPACTVLPQAKFIIDFAA